MEEDGSRTHHYEIRKEAGYPYSAPNTITSVSDLLEEKLKHVGKKDLLDIVIGLKGLKEWDVDILPPRNLIAVGDWAKAKQSRTRQLAKRVSEFKKARDEVVIILNRAQATVVSDGSESGIIVAKVTPDIIPLLKIDAVSSLDIERKIHNNKCTQTNACQLTSNRWRLGHGVSDERLYAQAFHNKGYTGDSNNYSRQNSGSIAVGVLESLQGNGWEDEFRGYRDGTSTTHRIWKRYTCLDTHCSSTLNYLDAGSDGSHSIGVMSIIAADFTRGQANGLAYGDDCYTAPSSSNGWDDDHCYAWEKAASGMAPKSKLVMYRSTLFSGAIHATNKSILDNVDILNMSTSEHDQGSSSCSFVNPDIWESALENAFDDGIFVVNAPDNRKTNSTTCNLDSPGDMPKVFTVNALDARTSGCRANYGVCPLASFGAVVGIDAPLANGSMVPGAVTGVDLTAPGALTFLGGNETSGADIGIVDWWNFGTGTSFAAPHVSGTAALVKHWFLATYNNWINNPGRLHAIMLGMGDRAESALYHKYWSATDKWGLGRLKLRLFDWTALWGGWAVWTNVLTSTSGNITKRPFGNNPIPSNASFVKCVLNEAEDMSDKNTIGDLYFKMTLSDPVNGQCTSSSGNTRYDSTYDLKHMISFEDQSTVGGKCVNYTIINAQVASNVIMVNAFCYYSQVKDNEPH